jgi:small subunit ribosomal protein S6
LATNVYEGMFILDSNWYSRDPSAASAHVQKMIEEAGGEMLTSRLWEDRRLAYPIKNRRRGAYWLTYFSLDSFKLNDIYKACNLSDHTLRAMLLKVDARIADTLVEHAKSAGVVTPPAAVEETAPKEEAATEAASTEELAEVAVAVDAVAADGGDAVADDAAKATED